MAHQSASVNNEEQAKFEKLGTQWWDINGPMKPLHAFTPTRTKYIEDQWDKHKSKSKNIETPINNLKIIDIGCGGGLLSEALTQSGAKVTGVDLSAETIDIAQNHAKENGLTIDYRISTAEDLAKVGETADIVVCSEVIEHVENQAAFLKTLTQLMAKDGLLILTTLNRTPESLIFGKYVAEYILNLMPHGTHDHSKFVKPSELNHWLDDTTKALVDVQGFKYNPFDNSFMFSRNTAINYGVCIK